MKKWWLLSAMVLLAGCHEESMISMGQDDSTEEANSSSTEQVASSSEPESIEVEEKRISFYGVGDNLIHDSIYRAMEQAGGTYDFSPIYEELAADIGAADIAFINQETIFAGTNFPYAGYPSFNTPDDMANDLHELGFDLVNGATNHTLDYGTEGAMHANGVWKSFEDMRFIGAFQDEADSENIRTIERDGVTFSFLAYTYGTNGVYPDTDWRIPFFDEEKIRQDVAKAKEVSDIVLVSAHWGDENTTVISDFQKKYAQLFADLEVDVVIGTHPHIVQPIEWLTGENGNEMLVAYSLGNLVAHSYENYNQVGGALSFDFVVKGDETVVENVQFRPTVCHYTYKYADGNGTRGFRIYYLDEYSNDLAAFNGLNEHTAEPVTVDNLEALIEPVIATEFR